ncbi:S9 family peptidase [Rubrivivax gelatinosus]|nr:S9 family peptidase [Rubrivivax gelatinosus]
MGRWFTMRRFLFSAACAATALALAGCASAPPADAVVAPNAKLVVQGIPPIPQALAERVQRYNDFRGHGFADWHPTQREMLVLHRGDSDATAQLYRLAAPGGMLERLTAEPDPVAEASWEPQAGRYIVFARGRGGNEATQLYRLDPATRQATLLTDADQRHDFIGWLHGSSRLLYGSVPLDRTADGGRRAAIDTTLWLTDPLAPEGRRQVAVLPGAGWFGGAISYDDRTLAITRYVSATESEAWLVDLASGERRRVLPAPGETLKASHFPVAFRPDGSGLLFISDRAGEFRELMLLALADGRITRISAHIPWDVSGVAASEDGRWIALQANVEGRDELRLFDGRTLKEAALPPLPAGSIGSAVFDRRRGELAFSTNSAQGPSRLHSLDLTSGQVAGWTTPYTPPGLDTTRFGEAEIVRWTSFDGRTISGLLHRPPARFTGPRPVLIQIHGGPEGQATVGFMGRYNYLLQELGVAIVQPNVRGSEGFGKTFLSLDNGMLREDSVKDIGALLDWIATQPGLDASRVLVAGGSYGGYMTLAVATHYAERIAGSVDDVGISHFVTFLQNTESYRRDLRRAEYGDERDPAMRAFLDRISPLSNAGKIRKPLFVVQGLNDPRVPYTEAEQIVAQVRANGTPVWYLRAENEGHGFQRKENADWRFYAFVRFAEQVLLGR